MTHRASHSVPVRLTILAALMASLAAPALAAPGDVVISQVYGGGGNSGATLKNDFIELFNRSSAPVDLSTWSVQYASSTGSSWALTRLTGTIQPGQYYLVQEAAGTGGSANLPQPDATGTLNMSGTAGKVALVSSQAALSGTAPTSSALEDVVGFGSATNFSETAPTPTLSNSTAAIRNDGGCTDTNNNNADFTVGGPTPRNSASPYKQCSGGGGTDPTPIAQPIVLNCPASISGSAGTAFSGLLQASDPDSIVNAAAISAGARAGITLTGFTPAAGTGGSASAQLSVDASVAGGSYPVTVTFTNNDSQSGSCTVNVLVSGEQKISALQGSGAASPFNNTVQTTTGVVTKVLTSGYYIQDPDGDNDPTTPEAIYVYTGSAPTVQVGTSVRVTGTVTEYTPSGAPRSYTEIKDITATTNLGAGKPVTVTNIQLGAEDLRRYEGMLVRFSGALTVNGNGFLGDRGELVLGNGRLETPTNRYRPGPEANALAAANERNMVVLDDNSFTTPAHIPYLFQDQTVRSGDTVNDLVGVLDFGAIGGGGGWYKLQPTDTPTFSRTNVREAAPTVAPGNVRVASANVLNFFTTFTNGGDADGRTGQGCTIGSTTRASNCRGADNMAEYVRQRDKIVNELKAMDADAVGLMEIQNNGDTAATFLVNALNAATAPGTYAVVPKPAATGTDAIRVAMIYKPAKLTLVGGALSDNDDVNNRPPMAQTFKVNSNGAKFSLVVNHLKSKGSCGGGTGNTDSGDGQGCWNATRVLQAQRLVDVFIPQIVQAAGDARVLAVGDFNSYGHEDPIAYMTGKGMVNELERFVRGSGNIPYSYVFDGMAGYLDHALATSALDAQVAGVTEWHNNADEPEAIDYNIGDTADDPYVNNAFRASDHDPVVVSLNLAGTSVDVTSDVKIAQSGLSYNRFTSQYTGTVTITNTSGKAINGPLQFMVQGLPTGVTLVNQSGVQAGVPYITLPASSLAAGASATVTTTFGNPNKVNITYTPKLVSGTF